MAPEVLQGKYDYRCDYWSLGVVMYTLLGGYPPFFGDNNKEIFRKVMEGKLLFDSPVWLRVTKQAKELISKLIVKRPEHRLTAAQALEHPWFEIFAKEEDKLERKMEMSTVRNLRNYKKLPAFKKEVMRVVFSMMTEDEIKKEKHAFRHIDLDNDGKVNVKELRTCFEEFGFHDDPTYIEHLIKDINGNEKGDCITYTNFLMASLDLEKYRDKGKIIAVYNYLDIDNNVEFITRDNFKQAMERTGKKIEDDVVKKMLMEINAEEKVTRESFLELMLNEDEGSSPCPKKSKKINGCFIFLRDKI